MFSQKWLWLVGLSVLLASCSTSNYLAANSAAYSDNSPRNKGIRYLLGRGVPQDNQRAFYYFSKAAHQGDVLAQNEIAYMYAAGKGTPRNQALAFDWYKQAATHGLASAQYNLGLMYLHGIGTAKDKTLAMVWIKKSAANGFHPARTKLAQVLS